MGLGESIKSMDLAPTTRGRTQYADGPSIRPDARGSAYTWHSHVAGKDRNGCRVDSILVFLAPRGLSENGQNSHLYHQIRTLGRSVDKECDNSSRIPAPSRSRSPRSNGCSVATGKSIQARPVLLSTCNGRRRTSAHNRKLVTRNMVKRTIKDWR